MKGNPTAKEYGERAAAERSAARRRHGPTELLPVACPDTDVMDRMIWLQMEMARLADAMEARVTVQLQVNRDDPSLCTDPVRLARMLGASASRGAFDLIQLRRQLLKRGHTLGAATTEPEKRS